MPIINLADRIILWEILEKESIKPKRSAGQNFLVCEEVVQAILAVLPEEPRNITELGAGLGVLTGPLLGASYNVRAIERDERVANVLQKYLPKNLRSNLDLKVADLSQEEWSWNEEYCLVGNIPYNLSGLIVRRITQLDPLPTRVVLLVQREVGQRLTAEAPNMHLNTLAVKLWGEAQLVLDVPADCFWPTPKVASQVIVMEPRKVAMIDVEQREQVLREAKRFYQQKRKQVQGVMKKALQMNSTEVEEILNGLGIPLNARPQEVNEEQWVSLAKRISRNS